MEWRVVQQLKIFIIIFIPLVLVALAMYWALIPEPTCFDGKLNQDEVETDCGGPCVPCRIIAPKELDVQWVRFVPAGLGSYDVAAEIINPNPDHGATRFDYEFRLLDGAGVEIESRKGIAFILPRELRHIVEINLETSKIPRSVELIIGDVSWVKRTELKIVNTSLVIREREFMDSGVSTKARARAVVTNQSPYLYRTVEVSVLLLDAKRNVVGLSKTILHDLNPGESRPLEFLWNAPLGSDISELLLDANVNVYDTSNFSLP